MTVSETRANRHADDNRLQFGSASRKLIQERIAFYECELLKMKETAKWCIDENYMVLATTYCNRIVEIQKKVNDLRKKLI
tara:strand:+ start:343 stop:582 length:240 start_codon:yes stop_codon:yes gene_type:complete